MNTTLMNNVHVTGIESWCGLESLWKPIQICMCPMKPLGMVKNMENTFINTQDCTVVVDDSFIVTVDNTSQFYRTIPVNRYRKIRRIKRIAA
ncbi:hypothetical protein TNCV_2739501 [Trichonephila clavipes]|nr:hypothetical protein TNCV_2739501 [Trichonephila clavipes]